MDPKNGGHLRDLLEVYGLKNLIKSPTRIGKTSSTLLDWILTNNTRRIFSSGVVRADISDHSIIYTNSENHSSAIAINFFIDSSFDEFVCCGNMFAEQKFSENVCVNFELVHGYNYDEEYVDYWQNWRKFRKKSVYDRKYNLLNHLLRTEKENFIHLTLNQMNKILNVFKLLDKTKFNKKRLINMRF